MNVRRTMMALALLSMPAGAQAKVWTVGDRGADFPLIAPAIAASGPHDVIRVRRGVYREDLVLDHPVAIVGEQGVVLFGTGKGTVIEISAPGCEVRGLTIDGTGTGASNDMDAAIRITSRVNHAFDLDLPLNTVFENPNISQLAEHIEKSILTMLGELNR